MRWSLARADIRMGEGDSVTRFAADSLSGQATPRGMAGDLRGASGKIGAVPLNMSEIDGKWRFADGALTLDGGLLVTDAAPDARFFPLVSSDASLRFADGIIEAKRSEEHTSELQSIMRTSYAVFCLKKKQVYSHSSITSIIQ